MDAIEVLKFYLGTNEFIAWYGWEENLQYLCTFESKLVEHNVSFLKAWNSYNAKKFFSHAEQTWW